jgi:hypothetical protein
MLFLQSWKQYSAADLYKAADKLLIHVLLSSVPLKPNDCCVKGILRFKDATKANESNKGKAIPVLN